MRSSAAAFAFMAAGGMAVTPVAGEIVGPRVMLVGICGGTGKVRIPIDDSGAPRRDHATACHALCGREADVEGDDCRA